MSAPPPGPPGTTPNGTAPRPRRKPKDTAALVQRRPAARKQASLAQRPGPAGLQAPPRPTATNGPAPISRPTAGPATFAERPRSPSPSMEPTILAVFATKRALLEGLRFHVARLQSKESVDVTNESQFTRPIRLHRRDPRIQPGGGDGMDLDSKDDLLDEKERERVEAAKLERQRIREENAKLIAPAAPSKKKPQAFKKKVEQVYRTDDNPEDRKRSQLRYEEALPWHLEDFDNKHIWQGSYEAALSECHVMLMHNPAQDGTRDAHLRLVPMEKWYRFREKNKVKYKAPEDVETLMNKKVKEPAFLIKHEQQEKIKKMYALDANKTRGLFQRAGGREEAEAKEAGDVFGAGLDTPADADDIDFNLDEEFADDEENPIFEGDDDTQKQAEERIKRDQLGANVFGMTDEQEVDEEAEREKKLAEMRKQLEKGTRKALLKREKNYDYETDSDGNPYSSESESEDSDAERLKEEERKKEEEEKVQQNGKGKEGEKPASGASTMGANTPSGRKEKHGDPSRKSQVSSSSLKRPGSPNLSEASGNESSRKKVKKQHGHSKSGTATPRPDGLMSRQPSFALGRAGSGSETEGNKSSRPGQKVRLVMSPKGTPRGSRAASPATGATNKSAGGSRAASPPNTTGVIPTKEEVRAQIPAGGISIKNLSNVFKGRGIPKEKQMDFIRLVREVATTNKETGLLVRRN